jgi:hypothetical protein
LEIWKLKIMPVAAIKTPIGIRMILVHRQTIRDKSEGRWVRTAAESHNHDHYHIHVSPSLAHPRALRFTHSQQSRNSFSGAFYL